jgi:serine/threonine protein kinase
MNQTYHISMRPTAYITDTTCQLTVLRGTTRFRIKVELAQVKGTTFGTELLQQLETWKGLPWGKARNEPISDLIYHHCLPLLERLAPQTLLQDLSLEAFLHSPTYTLELVRGGRSAEDIRIQGADTCLYTPAFFTSPICTADLPSASTAVPRFQARDIRIAPTLDEGESVDAIQGRVVTAAGLPLYFKPRLSLREPEFERELRILSRINDTGLAARLRVPRLHGIVVSGADTIGMLMTLITSSEAGTHLRSPGLQGRSEMHGKWEEQLTEIVRELHAHGIVWGDVHPMNIVIDEAMDAWAVDFGGMNNVEFVDDEKRETVEGDWQGVERIFGEWLPDPERRSRW